MSRYHDTKHASCWFEKLLSPICLWSTLWQKLRSQGLTVRITTNWCHSAVFLFAFLCDSLTIMLQQNFMTLKSLSSFKNLWLQFLTDNLHFKTKTAFPEIKIQESLEFLPSLALTGFHLSGWRLAPKQQQELRSCFASRETGKQDSRWSGLRLLKRWNWDSTTHRPWRKEWNDSTIFTAFCEFALKGLGTTMAYYLKFRPLHLPIDAWPFSHGSESHAYWFIGITMAY